MALVCNLHHEAFTPVKKKLLFGNHEYPLFGAGDLSLTSVAHSLVTPLFTGGNIWRRSLIGVSLLATAVVPHRRGRAMRHALGDLGGALRGAAGGFEHPGGFLLQP